jgi:hypothetical protein
MNRSALCALLILGGLVPAMLIASVTAPPPVAAFIAAHLLLLAGGPAAVLAGTVGTVLWLRRYCVPQGREQLADPAARQPSRADMTARAVPARPRRAIEASRSNPDRGAR